MSEALDRIRSRIEALGMGFQLIKPIQTKGNGVERETWLLDYEGAQFVFVPGQKRVTLGWDTGTCPLGPGVLEGLRKEFSLGHDYYYMDMMEDLKGEYQEQIAEAEQDGGSPAADRLRAALAEELEALEDEARERGLDSWDHHMDLWNRRLSQCLSPLRTADIGDMLVEADSRSLDEDAPSLDEAVRSLKKGPFTLATEDEWEYLCNGGARTLFRWGDTLEGVLSEIYAVGAVGQDENPESMLERPNALGLFIAYDSYQNEIIDNTAYTKGGDGGCSLCGGDGAIFVLPCYTAFYRHPAGSHCGISSQYHCYRRILRLP